MGFAALFRTAVGGEVRPFLWQRHLAVDPLFPDVLIAPTGSGKTAGVTLAWAHHRLRRPETTPRRLVWCLPMRSLVDQTAGVVRGWLDRLHAEGIDANAVLPRTEDVHILMGGADAGRWFENPERPAVIVGTQDMLLSRALMRGYASSRASWPMEFAVLHQDCQWIFDEVQLMNAGRATSAQLEAFRQAEFERVRSEDCSAGRPCRSLWISATLKPEWLETVDHPAPRHVMRVEPEAEDDDNLRRLTRAAKHLVCAEVGPASSNAGDYNAYVRRLAEAVVGEHRTGHMTLAIVNQVKRAQDLHGHVAKLLKPLEAEGAPGLALLHSRFRPADRQREMARVAGLEAESDIIVVATQAVEAGVDISAAAMFTELAPWASMVQRFGRANRRGDLREGAKVFWVDLLGSIQGDEKAVERHAAKLSPPYDPDELRDARDTLRRLSDAAPVQLPPPGDVDPPLRVVRRKDLDDLFDTDADLTGFDVDIAPYVRDADDTDVRVFWRELPVSGETPPKPRGEELCAVPIGMAKKWIAAAGKGASRVFFVRDPQWRPGMGQSGEAPPGWRALREDPWPGLTILADLKAGGYSAEKGFTGDRKHRPEPVEDAGARREEAEPGTAVRSPGEEPDGHDEDPRSEASVPVLLADHLRHVVREAGDLCDALGVDAATRYVIVRSARWHDVGKAHEVFQDTMRRGLNGHPVEEGALLAKTVGRNRHGRPYFRHELASALAYLAAEDWRRDADLGAFLIAAHHGKVRMKLRALPREYPPREPERAHARFARGVWEGDELPALALGDGERWSGGALTLSIMELGWDEATRESWTERTRDLLARHGPFRLAWMETLLRLADWRASAREEAGAYDDDG